MQDHDFNPTPEELEMALAFLRESGDPMGFEHVAESLPEEGMGSLNALEFLAPLVLRGASALGAKDVLAHMDPPTPWVTWITSLWNASLNQNLLHRDVAPVARRVEARVIDWIAPFFGMDGGHMTPGSTVSNLTALWAARELKGVKKVLASKGAHLSVAKAAHLLGLEYQSLETDALGRLDQRSLPDDVSKSALVLTAGATSTGAIDPLDLCGKALWCHVDGAWAGPLRFSDQHAGLLAGIERADSVSISAHKWLFQPKESALILFKETDIAHPAISFGGAYLATPNVGVLGSHGAVAVSLMATLLAWGRSGLAQRIDHTLQIAEGLYQGIRTDPRAVVFSPPQSGVLLWRPTDQDPVAFREKLPVGLASLTEVEGQKWLRQVAANPNADLEMILTSIRGALS